MDDFLHNLRSGKLKQPDRGNRPYGDQFKGAQRRNVNDRRKRDFENKESFERLNAIKDVLETLAETQKRMAKAYEARNRAEERKARAMEVLAMNIYKMVNPEAANIEAMFAPSIVENAAEEMEMVIEAAGDENEFVEDLEEPADLVDDAMEMEAEQSDKEKLGGNSRRKLIKLIDTLRSEGTSWVKIASEITAQGFPTISGRGSWRGAMVKNLYEKMSAEG
jgi:hypothetical protein